MITTINEFRKINESRMNPVGALVKALNTAKINCKVEEGDDMTDTSVNLPNFKGLGDRVHIQIADYMDDVYGVNAWNKEHSAMYYLLSTSDANKVAKYLLGVDVDAEIERLNSEHSGDKTNENSTPENYVRVEGPVEEGDYFVDGGIVYKAFAYEFKDENGNKVLNIPNEPAADFSKIEFVKANESSSAKAMTKARVDGLVSAIIDAKIAEKQMDAAKDGKVRVMIDATYRAKMKRVTKAIEEFGRDVVKKALADSKNAHQVMEFFDKKF